MTRFARAHGSKASNEKTPEEATSWSTMKQQMADSKVEKNPLCDEIISSFRKRSVDSTSVNPTNKVWEVFDTSCKASSESGKNNTAKKLKNNVVRESERKVKKTPVDAQIVPSGNGLVSKKISVKGNTFAVSSKGFTDQDVGTLIKSAVKSNKNVSDDNNCKLKHKQFLVEAAHSDSKNDHNALEVSESTSKQRKRKYADENKTKNSTKIESKDSFDKKKVKSEMNKRMSDGSKFDSQINHKKFNNSNDNNYSNSFKFNRFNNEKNFTMNIEGRIVQISNFQGFTVKKEDAQRLYKLRKALLSKGVPRKEVELALKAERRRAEKALAREKKVVCYKCRKFGHNMSECPENEDANSLCFKCGSTEHSVRECRVVQNESFRYAHCFICQEQGHIARQCPDNPRGLYPKGGSCKVCGDVTHLKKDCPELINEKEKSAVFIGTLQNNFVEGLEEDLNKQRTKVNDKNKVSYVKF